MINQQLLKNKAIRLLEEKYGENISTLVGLFNKGNILYAVNNNGREVLSINICKECAENENLVLVKKGYCGGFATNYNDACESDIEECIKKSDYVSVGWCREGDIHFQEKYIILGNDFNSSLKGLDYKLVKEINNKETEVIKLAKSIKEKREKLKRLEKTLRLLSQVDDIKDKINNLKTSLDNIK